MQNISFWLQNIRAKVNQKSPHNCEGQVLQNASKDRFEEV